MPQRHPILVLRHSRRDEMGFIAESLERYALPYAYLDLHDDSPVPVPLDAAAALIVLGGPMSVNDGHHFLEKEKRLIGEAMSRDKPVLGVCLGSQLMATVLGERVFRIPKPEIGWFAVRATAAAETDPLFRGWSEQPVFHWHNEGFQLPGGAVCLAESDAWGNQAFRYGDRHWGVQFHPEVTPAIIASWCEEDAACGANRELESPIDPEWNADGVHGMASTLFDRWAQMVIEKSLS
jgi:GMP synthase (glutamine-hydrolysing)